MSVTVTAENLGPCKRLLRIELTAPKVQETFTAIETDFVKQAHLPGFRPGKAPRDMVVKRYTADIETEVKKRLTSEGYQEAVKQQSLKVVGYPDVEETSFSRDNGYQFTATVELEPDFALPEYRGLPARRERTQVTDADIESAIELLRNRKASYNTVDREAAEGDVIVVNYEGTSNGAPLTDIAPTARGLTTQKNFWIEMKTGGFIPGFIEQVKGTKAGDRRTVNVEFPADFVAPALQGKPGTYEVEVIEVKEKVLPAVDEEFAKLYGAESLHQLREGVRADLQNELNVRNSRAVRNQINKALLDQVTCELPDGVVQEETRNVIYQIVEENQQRGVPKEEIERERERIFGAAAITARDRVKAHFIFRRIADKEGIRISQEDFNQRLMAMAQHYKMPVEKLVKELQKRNAMNQIAVDLVNERVVDFLEKHARIEDAPAIVTP